MKVKNKLSPAEKWKRLTFADNYIFCKVMETNPDVCKKMLEMLLDIKIDKIKIPETERTIKADLNSKGIRLDVYVKDDSGRLFDIEIQTSVAKNLALPKRVRYYQGLIDVDSVFSGTKYRDLKETFVIFLCLGDVFRAGLPVYSFENVCAENHKIKMNDGTHKIFFNAKKYDKMKSDELRSFFKYLCGKKPDSDFSGKIAEIVKRIKMNPRWRHEYMFLQDEIDLRADLAAEEAAEEARKEKVDEIAQKLLEMGLSPEQVSKGTSLPLEQVLELQKEAKLVKV